MQEQQQGEVQAPAAPIRPAASLLLIRDIGLGIEVLVMKRSQKMRAFPGFLAFPGGALEKSDVGVVKDNFFGSLSAQKQEDDPIYAVGAVRECAEETGLLCAVREKEGSPAGIRLTTEEQEQLLAAKVSLLDLLWSKNVGLDGEQLRFVGRWVTPSFTPIRFDTRFFLHVWEGELAPSVYTEENVWAKWMSPFELLPAIYRGQEKAAPPTVAMLTALATFDSLEECKTHMFVPGPKWPDIPKEPVWEWDK